MTDMKTAPQLRPAHVGISVPDVEEAAAWYRRVLGYAVVSDRYQAALRARVVFLERDGFRIELFQHDQPKPLPEERRIPNRDIETCGTKHLCFYTDDMDELKRHLDACGVDCATQVFSVGQNKVLFIRDCAGDLIEFIQVMEEGVR